MSPKATEPHSLDCRAEQLCPPARDGVGCFLEECVYAAAVTLIAEQPSHVASWWVFSLLTELLQVLFPFRILWQPCYFVLCVFHSL